MKKLFIGLFFLSFCLTSCQKESVAPVTNTTDQNIELLGSETINSGSYLGLTLGESAAPTYSRVQTLQSSQGVTYVNVVANSVNDLSQLQERIPLYQSLYLDEQRGTESGVQFYFKTGQVSRIYLNSGKQLTQWPANATDSFRIAAGDKVEALYEKLVQIKNLEPYANKFERISLLTKDLSKNFDASMSLSPQWYFTYQVETNRMDEVRLHFKEGKLDFITVNHYKQHHSR